MKNEEEKGKDIKHHLEDLKARNKALKKFIKELDKNNNKTKK